MYNREVTLPKAVKSNGLCGQMIERNMYQYDKCKQCDLQSRQKSPV